MPGTMPSHGACAMKPRPVFSMLPQEGSGGCAPRPRKLSADLEQHGIGEGDRRFDQQGRDHVGQDLAQQDPPVGHADRARRLDVLLAQHPWVAARPGARSPG